MEIPEKLARALKCLQQFIDAPEVVGVDIPEKLARALKPFKAER